MLANLELPVDVDQTAKGWLFPNERAELVRMRSIPELCEFVVSPSWRGCGDMSGHEAMTCGKALQLAWGW
jgi:hypothetical protein